MYDGYGTQGVDPDMHVTAYDSDGKSSELHKEKGLYQR
jgi:hypothetical protein